MLGAILGVLAVVSAAGSNVLGVPPVRVYAPSRVALVGSHAGVPAGLGRFEVRVLDIAMNPLHDATVIVDLSRCTDLQLCADQMDPSIVVDCPARTAVAHTNVLGLATFTLLGGSRGYSSGSPATIGACAWIYVPPYPAYRVEAIVTAYDLDGFAGVGANDFSVWLTDFGSGTSWARSDYDGSGTVGANDLSLWLQGFAEGWMSESCANRCP